ncbi:MAG: MBL fold metallo-hydrolase [Puniceicoccales bacterium]|nr:MBL fold metallo-hydrolase [Puniceicoccales bacterium]
MMPGEVPIEDGFLDLVAKAQRGLRVDDAVLAASAGVSPEALRRMRSGVVDLGVVRAVASVLELDAVALVAMACGACYASPPVVPRVEGLACFNTPFGRGLSVNNFLVWDAVSCEAAVFDTGTDAAALVALVRERGLRVRDIFITHTHHDHVAALGAIVDAMGGGVVVRVSERESFPGAVAFGDAAVFALGALCVRVVPTWGHSPGLTTFVVSGLAVPLAIVGDALFAGSMGGSEGFYREQRRHGLERILSLPDATVIAPGHGPLTSVGFEKRHNPVFAGR